MYNLLDTLREEKADIPLYVRQCWCSYLAVTGDIVSFFLKVALQLLDSDFHDENIREFAVEVLEKKLLDEDIEDYLLQLTQVCI